MNISKFKTELELSRKSPVTIDGYLFDLKQFNEYLIKQGKIIEEPSSSDVKDYIMYLHEEKYSPATIQRHFFAIRKYFKNQQRGEELRFIQENFLPPIDNRQTDYLTEEQINIILNTCDKLITNSKGERQIMHVRNKIIIYVFFISGLRRAELIKLREDDVELKQIGNCNGVLHVSRVKKKTKSKVGSIPLSGDDIRILKAWMQIKPKSEWLFPGQNPIEHISESTCWYSVQKVGKICGIHTFCHLFRHSCATLLLKSGVSLIDTAKFLGHENINTTHNFYGHHMTEEYMRKNMMGYRDFLRKDKVSEEDN